MRQHSIDLLPQTLRARTRARSARGRNAVYAAVGAVVIGAASMHARVLESRADAQLSMLKSQAQQLALNEKHAKVMQDEMQMLALLIRRNDQVELPIDVSRVVATVIDAMPESATLDRIEVDADRSVRSRGSAGSAAAASRMLVGEIGGFARSDLEIAEFVSNLEAREPFESVSLDFSRQRTVNEIPAREFRLSFIIDFSRRYRLVDRPSFEPNGARKEDADVD